MADSKSDPDSINASIVQTSLLLCRCIEEWQSETASDGDGGLNWNTITEKMRLRTGKPVSATDLKTIWKFIAYGKHVAKQEEGPTEGDSITYSDDEDPYFQPFSAIKRNKNAQKLENDKKNVKETTNPSSPTTPPHQRQYLLSTLPPELKASSLSRSIQINIPDHIRFGKIGIQPAIYVPISEMVIPPSRAGEAPKVRNSQVPLIAAVGNTPFLTTLKASMQKPVASHVNLHSHSNTNSQFNHHSANRYGALAMPSNATSGAGASNTSSSVNANASLKTSNAYNSSKNSSNMNTNASSKTCSSVSVNAISKTGLSTNANASNKTGPITGAGAGAKTKAAGISGARAGAHTPWVARPYPKIPLYVKPPNTVINTSTSGVASTTASSSTSSSSQHPLTVSAPMLLAGVNSNMLGQSHHKASITYTNHAKPTKPTIAYNAATDTYSAPTTINNGNHAPSSTVPSAAAAVTTSGTLTNASVAPCTNTAIDEVVACVAATATTATTLSTSSAQHCAIAATSAGMKRPIGLISVQPSCEYPGEGASARADSGAGISPFVLPPKSPAFTCMPDTSLTLNPAPSMATKSATVAVCDSSSNNYDSTLTNNGSTIHQM